MIVGVAICSNRDDLVPATLAANDLDGLPVVVFAGGSAPRSRRKFRTEDHQFAAPAAWDLWRRRNAALDTARALGWEALLLLDDDIRGLTAAHVRGAVYALEHGACIASFRIVDEIDTSCVGHCSIALGHNEKPPDASGACMFVAMDHASHFPPIYNEDLLFAREASLNDGVYSCEVIGDVRQVPQRDRFDVERARSQEFGEVLCEALEYGRRGGAVDKAYRNGALWRWALERRYKELTKLLADVCDARNPRVEAALLAALEQHDRITPDALRSFYEAWRADVAEGDRVESRRSA